LPARLIPKVEKMKMKLADQTTDVASDDREPPSSQPCPQLSNPNGWEGEELRAVTALREYVKLTRTKERWANPGGHYGAGEIDLERCSRRLQLDAGEFRFNGKSVDRTSTGIATVKHGVSTVSKDLAS